jgi:hypothetical protein
MQRVISAVLIPVFLIAAGLVAEITRAQALDREIDAAVAYYGAKAQIASTPWVSG